MKLTRNDVLETIAAVARQKDASLKEVRPEQFLIRDLGLDSLSIARIIATLLSKVQGGSAGYAPAISLARIRTVGDVCKACGCDEPTV